MNKFILISIAATVTFAVPANNDSLFLPVRDSSKVELLKVCQDSLVQLNSHSKDSLETLMMQFYTTPFGVQCRELIQPATKKQKKVRK